MNSKRIHTGLIGLVAAGLLASGQAQAFGLDAIKSVAGAALHTATQGNSNAADNSALEQQHSDLMLRFNASMNNMLIAQAKTLQATGNTDAATQTMNAAQQYAIGGVSDSDVIQRDTQLTSTNQQLIQNALSQAAAMSGENRAALIEAIPYYTAGIQEGTKLSGAFSQWINNAQGAAGSLLSNPMAAAQLTSSLGDATTIARNLPALLSAWSGTSQSFMSYASANQLDVSTLQTALNAN